MNKFNYDKEFPPLGSSKNSFDKNNNHKTSSAISYRKDASNNAAPQRNPVHYPVVFGSTSTREEQERVPDIQEADEGRITFGDFCSGEEYQFSNDEYFEDAETFFGFEDLNENLKENQNQETVGANDVAVRAKGNL